MDKLKAINKARANQQIRYVNKPTMLMEQVQKDKKQMQMYRMAKQLASKTNPYILLSPDKLVDVIL